MTVQPAHAPAPKRQYPAKNLDAITPVFNDPRVDQKVRDEFRLAYANAWTTAKAEASIEPLLHLVERWWPDAVLWSDPDNARVYLERIEGYLANGIPPEEKRYSSAEVLEMLEAKHGPGSMGPAWDRLAGRR